MASEGIFCSGCGITLRPFMKVCPRCGLEREGATPLEPQPPQDAPSTASPSTKPKTQTEVVKLHGLQDISGMRLPGNLVFLPPEEPRRRFPLLTTAQWSLIAMGAVLLLLILVIVALLWRQQRFDPGVVGNRPATATNPSPTRSPSPEPIPTIPIESIQIKQLDDLRVTDAVKSSLMAYNPLGFSRYKIEVKDGVVTLEGDTEHQPEKDGAENVVKLVPGVKSVVNNMKVKPEQALAPVKLNVAEARLLDEALRRQVQEDEKRKIDQQQQPQGEAQREAERLRREQAAAKQREEEIALRKAAEEKLRRETEEYERRQEELRRVEAERRARAEQARLDTNVLRSGTVAWSGIVDGVEEIIFSGGSASVRHLSGNPPREVRASFSAPLPRSPVTVSLIATNGRGPVEIIQQPSGANGYTTIIRIDDSGKGGDRQYEFTLRWELQ
jgi:BON domain